MALALFLFKIAVPPVLVAVMTLMARWFGPTIGGLLMGLPWMTGPVLFFLTFDNGTAFGVTGCIGVALGTVSIAAFILTYALVSKFAPWPVALPCAAAGFAVVGMLLKGVALPLWQAAGLAIAALVTAYQLIPVPRTPTPPAVAPWWDIPARMVVTFGLVAGIMTSAERLGGQMSGIVASFPVILTVVGSFTHHQLGRDAVLRIHRGISLSLIGFVLFFLVAGTLLPITGLGPAFALASIAAVSFSGGLIAISRFR